MCGDSPNLVCKGSVAAFKGTYIGITVPCIVRGREENTVALVSYWGALCLHTAPTETYFLSKGRNFGNTSSSSLVPLVVISDLYFVYAYVVVYLLLVLVALVVSFITVHPIVVIFVNTYVVYPNLLRLIKKWSLPIHPPSSQPYRSFQLVSEPRLFIKGLTTRRVWKMMREFPVHKPRAWT